MASIVVETNNHVVNLLRGCKNAEHARPVSTSTTELSYFEKFQKLVNLPVIAEFAKFTYYRFIPSLTMFITASLTLAEHTMHFALHWE